MSNTINSNVPSEKLKAQIMTECYTARIIKLDGYKYLSGQHRTGSGIYVVDGVLDRQTYKECVEEAKAAGIGLKRLYFYGYLATYSGPGIDFTKFDDLGLANLDRRTLGVSSTM